jgi:flagellar hook protein FlgE
MMRSLFTAIGGLKNHQVMLDVTANNLANVNTVGYKSQRVNFETMMAQTLSGASAPVADGVGGAGPTQVGLGMTLNSIGSIMTQGSSQTTGQWSDLMIQGDGYFTVAHDVSTSGTPPTGALPATPDISFTRAGNFTLDANGWLVTQHGEYVLAQAPDPATPGAFLPGLVGIQIPTGAKSVSIDQNGVISYDNGGRQIAGQIQLAKFPNPAGLSRTSGNLLKDTPNSGIFDPANAAGAVAWGSPNTNGIGYVQAGALEMSNVDVSQEFTNMIVAQRGFQANARTVSVSDSMLQELVDLKR